MINQVMVSTDSSEYKKLSEDCGAYAPFLRPAAISKDSSTDIEFVLHALDWLKANDVEPDFIVHIRPTTPLRNPEIIDLAIKEFIHNPSFTALRSIHEMPESAYKTFEVSDDGSLMTVFSHKKELDHSNLGRQLFPKTYIPNGYVDVLRTSFIREHHLLHGNNVLPYLTNTVTEIDEESDFEFLKYQISVNPRAKEIIFN